MYKGIFFSHDPGGTNALIPVVKKLTSESVAKTFNYASGFAAPIWKATNLDFIEVDRLDEQSAATLLAEVKPDFVFTGTSEDPTIEFPLWRAAQTEGILTFSIVDHWTRYRERYLVRGHFCPTDRIFVIDDLAKKEMIRLGFHRDRIFACGQPHFEQYYRYHSPVSRSSFCDSLNLSAKPILLFVSDIVSTSFSGESGTLSLGFDEHTTLNDLLTSLEESDRDKDFQLVIKLHPKESEENFTRLLATRHFPFPVHVVKQVNNLDLLFHAHAVVGMFSMMLFEAYLMQKPVLSVQLNATRVMTFGENDLPVVTRPTELVMALDRLMLRAADLPKRSFMAATDCIIKVLQAELRNKAT